MLHGAIVWLLAVPLLVAAAAFGAGGFFGGWYGGLAGTPAGVAAKAPFEAPMAPGNTYRRKALVVVDAYGKVLSRPGLDAQRRELCTLAAIAMLTTPRQLHAHLRGALLTGSTKEEVDQVLALVEQDLDAARALGVWELWADVRERQF